MDTYVCIYVYLMKDRLEVYFYLRHIDESHRGHGQLRRGYGDDDGNVSVPDASVTLFLP